MKAGVYEAPNGKLIYVAKDRSIKAVALAPESSWAGKKVSHRSKDDTVLIVDTEIRCTRYADVPDGCTDHQGLVDRLHAERKQENVLRKDVVSLEVRINAKPAIEGLRNLQAANHREVMRIRSFRPVGRQAARRHRRKGHEVVTDDYGQRWWRP